jgi:CDP-diacylglycerol--glycerol-3-phosphate 3-phosphatidyltransferase
MNLPNQLTVARLGMALLFVALLSVEHFVTYALGYVVFIAAAITDYWDGKLARQMNLVTNFGKLLDPVADKVLMASGFIMLMNVPDLWIPGWTVVTIIAREFLITGARALAASDGTVIAANRWGKTKTVLQMTYVLTFLFFVLVRQVLEVWAPQALEYYAPVLRHASLYGIVFVAMYTVYSGFRFASINWRILNLGSSM